MRYVVEKFEDGLLVERTTYDVPLEPDPEPAAALSNVVRGPWPTAAPNLEDALKVS